MSLRGIYVKQNHNTRGPQQERSPFPSQGTLPAAITILLRLLVGPAGFKRLDNAPHVYLPLLFLQVVYPDLTDNSRAGESGTIVSFHHCERRRRYGTELVVLPTAAGRSRVDLYHDPCLVA
jgi:hypothetical protein